MNKDCWGAAPVREWRKQRCSRNAGQITLRIEGETVIEGDGSGKWSRAEVILLVIDSVLFFQQPRNFARNGKCGTNNLSIIQHACAIYLDFLHLRSAKRIKTPAILIGRSRVGSKLSRSYLGTRNPLNQLMKNFPSSPFPLCRGIYLCKIRPDRLPNLLELFSK